MMAISLRARFSFRHALRLLGVAAALLTLSTVASQRAEALSPVNPGMAGTSKTIANGQTIEVRGGHGGGSGGHGSGGVGGGRGFGGAVVGGGAIGAGAAVAAGSPRFAGRTFIHRRHFGGVFVGGVYYGDYPYDDSDYYDHPPVYPAFVDGGGCRRVMTVHGPRVVCHHRAARHHRVHRRHHHRRHHHA
jgi:hypothetical protein